MFIKITVISIFRNCHKILWKYQKTKQFGNKKRQSECSKRRNPAVCTDNHKWWRVQCKIRWYRAHWIVVFNVSKNRLYYQSQWKYFRYYLCSAVHYVYMHLCIQLVKKGLDRGIDHCSQCDLNYTNILICFVKYTQYSISRKAIFKSDLNGYLHPIHYIKLIKLIKDGVLRFKINLNVLVVKFKVCKRTIINIKMYLRCNCKIW